MGSARAQTESAAWKGLNPADMSFEDLQAASSAISASFAAVQQDLNQLNNARLVVLGEIGRRFGTELPGVPHFSNLPEYPAEFVSGYQFATPVAGQEVTDAPAQEGTVPA